MLAIALPGVPPWSGASLKSVPAVRIRAANQKPLHASGDYVLYWMIASRRLRYNFALDRALEHCRALGKPLLIFEALRCGYQWASDRLHAFVIEGMADNAALCHAHNVAYFPYLEPHAGDGKGLLEALSRQACVVVTDEFPCFFLPRMVEAAGAKLNICLEVVDSNGLLPLRATNQIFGRAFDFRRFLQKTLPEHLERHPAADPLRQLDLPSLKALPEKISHKWRSATAAMLSDSHTTAAALPIDHAVAPAAFHGGPDAATQQLKSFLHSKFQDYGEHRNEPERNAVSGLSPYLHFGHLSIHEVFSELCKIEKWKPEKLAVRPNGSREGWWNMSPTAEGFLDEIVTWREVGYNFASHSADYDQYDSLPDWAKKRLNAHKRDHRAHLYSLAEFELAQSHDPLWNAAQIQLMREGRLHNYLRMLWGKKILEWSKSPQEAARIMIHLNNKYGVDGRNPNSYTGIFWVLGRYDRPWAPERPVFGVIRYMSSENTARKYSVKNYIRKYSPESMEQAEMQF
jgi:deoxyribodipyrimidine photo-lyase